MLWSPIMEAQDNPWIEDIDETREAHKTANIDIEDTQTSPLWKQIILKT